MEFEINFELEEDGRWIAAVERLPGVLAYGATREEAQAKVEALAAAIITRLGLEGLLCVEVFVTRQGDLLVNELAPRPHNSYHQSERGCVTSQFEQHVRAVCNLPLGDTALITPAAIVNLAP